jgi:hypothetical protein
MNDGRDPLAGLRPSRPPSTLRTRVLGAAGEASRRQQQGIFELLVADRTLRWLAAAILVLATLNAAAGTGAILDRRSAGPSVIPTISGDEVVPQLDVRTTAAEQAPALASILEGRRG